MKYLICNLKAHKTLKEIIEYKEIIKTLNLNNINLIIAPSAPYLSLFNSSNINLCTQDISLNNDLFLTGDISIETLKSLNVQYTLIGHFERKKYYHEDEFTIIKKIKLALKNNIKVIYFIGETKEELARHIEYKVIEQSIARILNHIPTNNFKDIIIAYEPPYLIGGDKINIPKVKEILTFIKNLIKNYYNEEINLVFGGSITKDNIKEFKNFKNLDGFIVSSSILDPSNLKDIIPKI